MNDDYNSEDEYIPPKPVIRDQLINNYEAIINIFHFYINYFLKMALENYNLTILSTSGIPQLDQPYTMSYGIYDPNSLV